MRQIALREGCFLSLMIDVGPIHADSICVIRDDIYLDYKHLYFNRRYQIYDMSGRLIFFPPGFNFGCGSNPC
ncbi:hypothetical protein NPIL_110691 [Nephila pilipes]|uniref:Uncharacterized protein n=1 Tax=Nephila pilipes TaxID=299642 RepID=A0A8X6Q0C0_NEPPI|nr:hypothetical protein NPIL_110691 [Nephila pilipes]